FCTAYVVIVTASITILFVLIQQSFFFFQFRQPQSSTLFPYTTLFRSRADHRRAGRARRLRPGRPRGAAGTVTGLTGPACRRPDRDRKSTRLNSSHVKISYAVFCLKKKNQQKCKKLRKNFDILFDSLTI